MMADPTRLPNKRKAADIMKVNEERISMEAEHVSQLLGSVCSLKDNGILTDIVLCCSGKEFMAHKVVLVGGSRYFYAMFTGSMKEATAKKVELEGVSPDALDILLQFMYTGKISVEFDEEDLENVRDLLEAADLLQIDPICNFAWLKLGRIISDKNFSKVWALSEMYSNEEVKQVVLDWVADNFQTIRQSEAILSVPLNFISNLLEHSHLRVSSQDEVLQLILDWVGHDLQGERKELLLTLLAFVKFPLLTYSYLIHLNGEMGKNPVLSESKELQAMITQSVNSRFAELDNRGSSQKELWVVTATNKAPKLGNFAIQVQLMNLILSDKDETIANWSEVRGAEKKSYSESLKFVTCINCHLIIYFVGGITSQGASRWVFSYHTLTCKVQFVGHLKMARYFPGVAVLGGNLYVIGGNTGDDVYTTAVERFNPNESTFESIAPLLHDIGLPTATNLNGKLFVVGSSFAPMEIYNPTTNQWTEIVIPVTVEQGIKCLTANAGLLYLLNANTNALENLHVYDVGTDKWFEMELPDINLEEMPIFTDMLIRSGVDQQMQELFLVTEKGSVFVYEVSTNVWKKCAKQCPSTTDWFCDARFMRYLPY